MSDLIVPNIICFHTQKQLTTLNKVGVLFKSVLSYLHAHNFAHAQTSLHACCLHTYHSACNLPSPVSVCEFPMVPEVYILLSPQEKEVHSSC